MKAQIPYLARLVRPSAGPAALRPPRQPFPGDVSLPVRWPGAGETARMEVADTGVPSFPAKQAATVTPQAATSTLQTATSVPQAGVAPLAARTPQVNAVPEPPAGSLAQAADPARQAAGGSSATAPDARPRQPAPYPPPAPRPQAVETARTGPAEPTAETDTSPAEPTLAPLPPPRPGNAPSAYLSEAKPPPWPDSLWGTPVELPHRSELPPAPGELDGRAAPAPQPRPTGLISGQDKPRTAAADRGQAGGSRDTGRTAVPAAPGIRRVAVAGRTQATAPAPAANRPQARTAAGDLLPPPAPTPASAPASHSITMPGHEAAGRRGEPGVPGRSRVSIGTIEVTVVPAAPPAPAVPQAHPPVQAARGRSRPPSLLAAGPGADRRQDGLRRWYGIAQG